MPGSPGREALRAHRGYRPAGENNVIEVKSTGLVYRNPKPYLRSIHAWHPTIVPLGGGGMLAGFDLAEAVSAANYRSWVARSNDGGRTWSEPRRLVPGHTEITDFIRLSRLSDGTVLGVGQRKQPDLETQSWNPKTYGCRPGEWFTIRSADNGETWSEPQVFEPAVTGQPWEHCHAALETADGRLLLPAGLVRTWEGKAPTASKRSPWSPATGGDLARQRRPVQRSGGGDFPPRGEPDRAAGPRPAGGRLAVQPGGRAHGDEGAVRPGPRRQGVQRARVDGDTGRDHQARRPRRQPRNVVHAQDRPARAVGLRVADRRDRWVNEAEAPVWQGADSRMFGDGRAAEELAGLQFGFPNPHLLEDGDVLVAFWCLEDCIHNIRWVRLGVEQ